MLKTKSDFPSMYFVLCIVRSSLCFYVRMTFRETVIVRGPAVGAGIPVVLEAISQHLKGDEDACVILIAVRQTASHWAQHLRRIGVQVHPCIQAKRLSISDYGCLTRPGSQTSAIERSEELEYGLGIIRALAQGLSSQTNVLLVVDDLQLLESLFPVHKLWHAFVHSVQCLPGLTKQATLFSLTSWEDESRSGWEPALEHRAEAVLDVSIRRLPTRSERILHVRGAWRLPVRFLRGSRLDGTPGPPTLIRLALQDNGCLINM